MKYCRVSSIRQPQTGGTWKWERTLSGYWHCHLELTLVPPLLRFFLQWTVQFWPGTWSSNTETVLRLGILSRPSILNFIYLKYLFNFGLINNCRTLYKYAISHNMSGYRTKHLSTAADQELADDQLPPGHTPVWIKPLLVVLLRFRCWREWRPWRSGGHYQDVLVLYYHSERDERAAAWCDERGWKYHDAINIYGCEAQCVVLIEYILRTEYLARGRNMLIILNKR